MQVRDGMSEVVLTLGPTHTLREAAQQMSERGVGAALVEDDETPVACILTERDILLSLGAGEDPDVERVADHMSDGVISASPDWSLERAAAEMSRRVIRHLIVYDGAELVGVLSMRDIVRVLDQRGRHLWDDPRLTTPGAREDPRAAISRAVGPGSARPGGRRPAPAACAADGRSRGRARDQRPQHEQGGEQPDDRVDPAAHHEALGVDPADGEGDEEGQEGRQPGGPGPVDQLAGLGDASLCSAISGGDVEDGGDEARARRRRPLSPRRSGRR